MTTKNKICISSVFAPSNITSVSLICVCLLLTDNVNQINIGNLVLVNKMKNTVNKDFQKR